MVQMLPSSTSKPTLFPLSNPGCQKRRRKPGSVFIIWLLGCLLWSQAEARSTAEITPFMQSATTSLSEADLSAKAAFNLAENLLWQSPAQVTGILPHNQERWYRLRLRASSATDRMLEIPHPLLGVVDVWMRDADGRSAHDKAGMRVPYSQRKQPSSNLTFLLPADFKPPVDILIRVNNEGPFEFSAFINSVDDWLKNDQLLSLFYGAFYGAMLVLFFYNLFLAWGLKDVSYLLYVIFLFSLVMVMTLQSGFGKQFLWPDNVGLESQYLVLFSAINTVTGLTFLNVFLEIRRLSRGLWWLSLVIISLAVAMALAYSLGFHPPWLITLIYFNMLVSLVYYVVVPVVAYLRGTRYARFAIVALWVYPVSVALYFWQLAKGTYLLHPPHLVMAIGILLEGILLSLALTDKINLLRLEKKKAEKQADQTRKSFARSLIQAQEKERENFAAVLHDSIGHDLLILKHGLENLASWGKKPNMPNSQVLQQLQEQCDSALMDVRQLSHQMHPHVLKRLGLNAAIETMLENAANAAGLDWAADLDEVDELLDAEQASTIYRVIQESLNNILKHAQASEVMVRMQIRGPQVLVSIKDDGSGAARSSDKGKSGQGLGIENMSGRLELLSGWLRIIRQPGEGTEVRFGIPFQ